MVQLIVSCPQDVLVAAEDHRVHLAHLGECVDGQLVGICGGKCHRCQPRTHIDFLPGEDEPTEHFEPFGLVLHELNHAGAHLFRTIGSRVSKIREVTEELVWPRCILLQTNRTWLQWLCQVSATFLGVN